MLVPLRHGTAILYCLVTCHNSGKKSTDLEYALIEKPTAETEDHSPPDQHQQDFNDYMLKQVISSENDKACKLLSAIDDRISRMQNLTRGN